MMLITKEQARCFILRKQGLLGKHRFIGKEGARQYVRQAGCIQYDPVDVCGKNVGHASTTIWQISILIRNC